MAWVRPWADLEPVRLRVARWRCASQAHREPGIVLPRLSPSPSLQESRRAHSLGQNMAKEARESDSARRTRGARLSAGGEDRQAARAAMRWVRVTRGHLRASFHVEVDSVSVGELSVVHTSALPRRHNVNAISRARPSACGASAILGSIETRVAPTASPAE